MNAPSVERFPTFRRIPGFLRRCFRATLRLPGKFFRLLFNRKSGIACIILTTAVCLFYAACNWHFRRAWEKEKTRIVASGSSLDVRQLFPPMPSEEDNFFATPILKKLYTGPAEDSERLKMWFQGESEVLVTPAKGKPYRKTIKRQGNSLEAWRDFFVARGGLPETPAAVSAAEAFLADHRFDDLFAELEEASLRPASRFLMDRVNIPPAGMGPMPPMPPMGHYTNKTLWSLIACTELRSRAMAATHDTGGAVKGIRVLSRISEAFCADGLMLGILCARGISGFGDIFLEGVRVHAWNDAELQDFFQKQPIDLYHSSWQLMAQVERGFACAAFENHSAFLDYIKPPGPVTLEWIEKRICPDGLWMRLCLSRSRYCEALSQAVRPLRVGDSWKSRWEELRAFPEGTFPMADADSSDKLFNRLIAPQFVRLDILRTAITVERHWLKHHRYPASLAELEPPLPGGIPLGLDGKPLRYRTNAEGTTFRIWSTRGTDPGNTDPQRVSPDDLSFTNE